MSLISPSLQLHFLLVFNAKVLMRLALGPPRMEPNAIFIVATLVSYYLRQS